MTGTTMTGSATHSGGWSAAKIAVVLYPFGAGAAAVNVFFASLIFSWIGGPVTSTGWSIGLGCLIGAPATWYFARHIRHLMDVADAGEETQTGA